MYIPLTFEGALQKCLFASGGVEGFYISGNTQYAYHWFTGSGQFVVNKGSIDNVEIYVIGGGGGGGNRNTSVGAGGGGGGGVNYITNGRLFEGTYNISVGAGGDNQTTANSNGFNGVQSSFIGSNISLIAGGGGGGRGDTASNGGTGGVPNGGVGGSGGTTSAGNGAVGLVISIANPTVFLGFGCGGGGAENAFSGVGSGFSCNDTTWGRGAGGSNDSDVGAPWYGMGGGGGNGSRTGKAGGSGSVLIKYPIYNYCNNNFNQTGSCDCRQITFDVTDSLNYRPLNTGSYLYMPCGGNQFVSASLLSYAPETVCAVSNSYYAITASFGLRQGFINSLYLSSAPECISKSIVETCTPEAFAPTCTSSMVTIYTPSASVSNVNYFDFVGKNATTHSTYISTTDRVNYFCISTGSLNIAGLPYYPQLLAGNFPSLFNTASCNNYDVTASWAGVASGAGSITYRYYQCGSTPSTFTFTRPSNGFTGSQFVSFCRDMSAPFTSTSSGTRQPSSVTFNLSGSCISPVFDTTTCGCP